MIAFELCDSKGKTLDYFTFPVMASEISITEGFGDVKFKIHLVELVV